MKKVMMVMAILVALAVLVSMTTVTLLFAVEAPKTTPATKQQWSTQQGTPQQAPTKKTPPASQLSKNKEMVHTKFWDIEVLECTFVRTSSSAPDKPCGFVDAPLNVAATPGQYFNYNCSYRIVIPPPNEITKADANYWGKKSGHTTTKVLWSLNDAKVSNTKPGIFVPLFTWEDVQTMRKHYTGKVCLGIGHMQGSLQSMTAFYNHVSTFEFSVETSSPWLKNTETNYENNKCSGNIYLMKSNY